MAFNEKLAARIRQAFSGLKMVEEKKMMGGLTFMVNGKMCVGIFRDKLMCRIDPAAYEEALTKRGCEAMEFGGKIMKGFVLVSEQGIKSEGNFKYWIDLSLAFNKNAKASRKRSKTYK